MPVSSVDTAHNQKQQQTILTVCQNLADARTYHPINMPVC